MQWFRFYGDAVNDPKVQSLSGDLFKFWVNLLCIASQNEGTIKISDLPFLLRMGNGDISDNIRVLIGLNLLVGRSGNTDYMAPHAWHKRQYKSDTSSDRMKRHRDRQRDVTVTPPETETETDIKIEPKGSTKKQTRGTRISAEWELPTEWGKWAESEHGLTYQEIVFQADKFKDYWIARADKGACKLDWQATWRNWIRSNIERKL